MKFTLTIDCGGRAFQPVHDDASEPERYAAAKREAGRMLELLGRTLTGYSFDIDRSGFLSDSNGNRCGQWSLSDDEEG
jgi:hypothetical protein